MPGSAPVASVCTQFLLCFSRGLLMRCRCQRFVFGLVFPLPAHRTLDTLVHASLTTYYLSPLKAASSHGPSFVPEFSATPSAITLACAIDCISHYRVEFHSREIVFIKCDEDIALHLVVLGSLHWPRQRPCKIRPGGKRAASPGGESVFRQRNLPCR